MAGAFVAEDVPELERTLEDDAAECFSRVAELGLAAACERGDAEEVKWLLHAGVNPDTRFEVRRLRAFPRCSRTVIPRYPCQFGVTGLMKAAARGHMGAASILMATGRRKGEMMLRTKQRESADLNLHSDDGMVHFS